MKSFT